MPSDVSVIVDVLSFSTAVSVACNDDGRILPYPLGRDANDFAQALGAMCAGKRRAGGRCLSPGSLVGLGATDQLVLPSPNGATLSLMAAAETVFVGCLRNARAVADRIMAGGYSRVVLVAAGERWRGDGSLRPAYEDMLGCGAIAQHLGGTHSVEVQACVAVFEAVQHDVLAALHGCQSGRELGAAGYGDDVVWASKVDCAASVPEMHRMARIYGSLNLRTDAQMDAAVQAQKTCYFATSTP